MRVVFIYHGIGDSELVEHADQGHVPDGLARNDADSDGGGCVDNEVNQHDTVQAENIDRGVADTVVDQQPVVRIIIIIIILKHSQQKQKCFSGHYNIVCRCSLLAKQIMNYTISSNFSLSEITHLK